MVRVVREFVIAGCVGGGVSYGAGRYSFLKGRG